MLAGRNPTNPVCLSPEEIARCQQSASSPVCATLQKRCNVLLGLNNCKPGKLNFSQVAKAHCVNKDYPTRLSRLYATKGIDGVLSIGRNDASNVANLKLDKEIESHLIAMACTPPPSPHPRWTVKLCTKELNKRMGVTFSQSTVWRALQRNELHPHRSEYWCIPEITEQFIFRMERVLRLYSLPYDSDYPIVCMDEAALQILQDGKVRLEATPGQTEKIDYDYKRLMTKNIFVFIEPKTGRYYVRATDSRTSVDWAHEIKNLTEHLYPNAKKIILISDNLNTHSLESLYKAFPPEEARKIASRITFVHTPVHGSWLNMAECGIHVAKVECIGKRFRTEKEAAELPARLKEWEEEKNAQRKPFSWKFTVEKARSDRPHLYKLEESSESSSGKYERENALCVPVFNGQIEARSLIPSASSEKEGGEIIDLCRSIDEDGNEFWSISLEKERIALHESVGKREIAPLLKQNKTKDGWSIPFPSKRNQSKESTEKETITTQVRYNYNFMAFGEDVVDLYNTSYDAKYPVVCIRKRPFDLENPSGNAWIGNLHNDVKPKQKKKIDEELHPDGVDGSVVQDVLAQEVKDNRLGLTFVYNPYTGEKSFRINDWSDDTSWAETFQDLVARMYPKAERIQVVVCGEDTEKMATLERICTPEEALRIALKLETHAVPTNGRWLNFAENEAITVCRQCLKDGVSSVEKVAEHLASWQKKRTFVDFNLTLNRFREVFSMVYRPVDSTSH